MIKLLHFREYIQHDGNLIPIELEQELPFVPRRIFFIRNVPDNKTRANHAHKECHQILIPLQGHFMVTAQRGSIVKSYVLSEPIAGVYVEPLTWLILNQFSQSAICMVLASHPYEVKDYVDDFGQFQKIVADKFPRIEA